MNNFMVKLIFEKLKREFCKEVFEIETVSIQEPWSFEQICGLVEDGKAVCAVGLLDGEVVCYYSFYNICDEGYVNNLAVRQDFRGKGFGAQLINDMIERAKSLGVGALTLEVNENNTNAISLYKKFGFEVEGVRVKFYNVRDDAFIMWKRDL